MGHKKQREPNDGIGFIMLMVGAVVVMYMFAHAGG